MKEPFFEMHRSDAVQILLGKDKLSSTYSNLKLASLLEFYFAGKKRMYLVKEDHLPLGEYTLTVKTF